MGSPAAKVLPRRCNMKGSNAKSKDCWELRCSRRRKNPSRCPLSIPGSPEGANAGSSICETPRSSDIAIAPSRTISRARRTILSTGSESGWWRAFSFSRYAFAIGGNRNHAPPQQLSLVITSKFVFCRLRITERTTRDWRFRPVCSLSKGELP